MRPQSAVVRARDVRFGLSMVFVLILITLQGPALGTSKPNHATIQVEKPVEFVRKGVNDVSFRLHIRNGDMNDIMNLDIVVGGDLWNPNSPYYLNKDHTIVAFDVDAVDNSLVYLFAVGDGDQVLVMKDLPRRVAILCQKAHFNGFVPDFAIVDKIVGDVIYVSAASQQDNEHVYRVAVRLFPDGHLSLQSFELVKWGKGQRRRV